MPYAIIDSLGYIKEIHLKISPFYRLQLNERIADYTPPAYDPKLEQLMPVEPITGTSVKFNITQSPDAFELIKAQKINVLQQTLDSTAKAKGYDSILSAVSYAVDPYSPFYTEAVAFASWRSQVWLRGFEILQEVANNTRPIPTDEELVGLLPSLNI